MDCITIYRKHGKAWEETCASTNPEYVYYRLSRNLLAHYVHKAPYIKRVTDCNNHDGTRTITVFYDNDTKAVYVVDD